MDESLLSQPTSRLPSSELPSTSPTEEDLDKLGLEIDRRRDATVHKALALKTRITREQARLKELLKNLDSEEGASSAFFKHVERQSALLQSVIRNYNIAADGYNEGKYLTDIVMAKSNVADVERRLRSVEVALQGSIEHDVVESETDVKAGGAETGDTGYSIDGVYTMLTPLESIGSVEFVPDERFAGLEGIEDRRKSLPPIGYFSV